MQDPKFSEIKEEVQSTIDEILKRNLDGKDLESGEGQKLTNQINDEVMKELQEKYKGFKFIINVNIFKNDGGINFSGIASYNPNNDGSLTVKYGNENFNAFVGLFAFSQ
jgi:hypothetical protein